MESKLEKEVRFLKRYAVVATLVCGLLTLTAFTIQNRKQKFEEIDVERINVVERDGTLRLVISNKARSSGPIQRGKAFGYAGGERPGMIFFNDEGTEAGGLTVGGKREDGDVRASASLTSTNTSRIKPSPFNMSIVAGPGARGSRSSICRRIFLRWSLMKSGRR